MNRRLVRLSEDREVGFGVSVRPRLRLDDLAEGVGGVCLSVLTDVSKGTKTHGLRPPGRAGGAVEIRLANGRVIKVDEGIAPDALGACLRCVMEEVKHYR